ncbi:tyrosine-type recombinase/integrase [Planobispora takensis]|nr:tyrosine-type recombinase/integrase [Planobispora takensis]
MHVDQELICAVDRVVQHRRHKPEDAPSRTTRGNLIRRDYVDADILKPAILAAGVPADMTFHDLRHTFASTALAEGVPISEVSRWLGHDM